MPSETRQILFNPGEVSTAVAEYHRRTRAPLPAGSLMSYVLQSNPDGIECVMVIAAAGSANSAPMPCTVAIQAPVLAAALLLFCRDRRIPLPSRSEKSLQIVGDQLGLIVTRDSRSQ